MGVFSLTENWEMIGLTFVPINHYLFHMANAFLVLSNVQIHILFLRLVLILASVCFILWGWIVLQDIFGLIFIDLVLWNLAFIVINIFYSIPLIKDMIPIWLKGEMKKIYEKMFKKKLSKKEFAYLMSFAKQKHVSMVNSNIITQGNPYEELLMLWNIPKGKTVTLRKKDKPIIDLQETNFVGMLETTFFMKAFRTHS